MTTLAAAGYLLVRSVWGIAAVRAVYATVAFGPLMSSVVGAFVRIGTAWPR